MTKKLLLVLAILVLLPLAGCYAPTSCKTLANVICLQNGYIEYDSIVMFNKERGEQWCKIECYNIGLLGEYNHNGTIKGN